MCVLATTLEANVLRAGKSPRNVPFRARAGDAPRVARRGLATVVADAQQPKSRLHVRGVSSECGRNQTAGAAMELISNGGRLLGFDLGDWSLLLAGFVLAGLSALLF
jgi:hypothetical protein